MGMIYAVNMTCDRDLALKELMIKTLLKHCSEVIIESTNTDKIDGGYGNGAGWPQSMMKVQAIKDMLNNYPVQDTDFILSVDSDVVFTSPEVFKYVIPQYGIIGIKHRPEYYTRFMHWSHMSGALIFIRGDIAKKITALTQSELDLVRFSHFKPYALTENEDVVLSYLCKFVGANHFDLGTVSGLSSGDFEQDIRNHRGPDMVEMILRGETKMKSFYHLNYCPTRFLSENVGGKWDIPKVLKMKGIEL